MTVGGFIAELRFVGLDIPALREEYERRAGARIDTGARRYLATLTIVDRDRENGGTCLWFRAPF